ncbi:hypothetical protein BaRGS_00040247 [Batillaria attramentaria]|uniref:Uncharacterized protein n=1 Tax=Batillaria attramentaria TaxID=370345 RepID=A0ABD0J0U9_9CAEN
MNETSHTLEQYCKILHRDRVCNSSSRSSRCECLDNKGLYQFTKEHADMTDNTDWEWSVSKGFAKEKKITFLVTSKIFPPNRQYDEGLKKEKETQNCEISVDHGALADKYCDKWHLYSSSFPDVADNCTVNDAMCALQYTYQRFGKCDNGNSTIKFPFRLERTNTYCPASQDFVLSVEKMNITSHTREHYCTILHRDGVCVLSSLPSRCECLDEEGVYQFTKEHADMTDNTDWVWNVSKGFYITSKILTRLVQLVEPNQ